MKDKEFTFDISVDAWIKNIVIEAETYDDALESLHLMDLKDIIDSGYVKSFDISNIDVEVEDDIEEDDDDDRYWESDDSDEAFSDEADTFINDPKILSEYISGLNSVANRYYALTKTPSGKIGIETQYIITDEEEKIIRNFFKSKNVGIRIFNADGIIRVIG